MRTATLPDRGGPAAAPGSAGDRPAVTVETLEVAAYTIPTERPESDGTLTWDETTMVVVHVRGGGAEGLGFSYTSAAAATVVGELLADVVIGADALRPEASWYAMAHRVRNVGLGGVVGSAVAAVDVALWDLAARLRGVPLADLLGRVLDAVPAYGSGGFTSYTMRELAGQLEGWAREGFAMVKLKVGRNPEDDPARMRCARRAVGDDVLLFVDANGAFARKEALRWAWRYADDWDVRWFEEPVPSNDLEGLRLLRDQSPPGLVIAAGDYGWTLPDFRDLLAAGAVDTLQVDVTRCGGYTPFRRVAALCEAYETPLSAHTAPALHVHVCCGTPRAVHVEWFHDHVRIERMLLEGAPRPVDGRLRPDLGTAGHGMRFRRADARTYRVT